MVKLQTKARLHALVPLAIVACVILLLALGGRARAVEIDGLIGFGQSTAGGAHYRPNTWTPVTVYLTGPSVHGRGQLQLHLRSSGYQTVYTRDIDLPDGNINVAENFAVDLSNNPMLGAGMNVTAIEAVLFVDGRKRASRLFALPRALDPRAFTVLALTRDSSGLNLLTKKRLHLYHHGTNGSDVISSMRQGRGLTQADFSNDLPVNLLYTDLRALPAMTQGYAAIDAVALADQPVDGLTEDQMEALRGYVRGGGLLLVSGGGDLSRLRSRLLADFLPLTPTGVRIAHGIPALEKRYGEALGSAAQLALTEGTLKPGARTLFADDKAGTPLVSAIDYGLGRVVFTSFDYLDPTLRGWDAVGSLWWDLLRTGKSEISAVQVFASETSYGSSYGSSYNGQPSGFQRLLDALAGRLATASPDPWLVGLFVVIYILLLSPVSYFVLKRIDRKELAWLTVPVLIALFTITSYLIGRGLKGGMLSAHRAVIVETTANSNRATAYGITSLYSPARTDYDIALTGLHDDGHMLVPHEVVNGAGTDLTLSVDTTPNTAGIRKALVRLWDQRTFATPLSVSIEGGIEAQARMVSDHIAEVAITNRTPYTLHGCALVSDGGKIAVGTLAPGQTSDLKKLTWSSPGPATNLVSANWFDLADFDPGSFNNSFTKKGMIDIPTSNKIASSMAEIVSTGTSNNNDQYNNFNSNGGQETGNYGTRPTVFVGWFSDPIMNVTVNGHAAPSGDEVNLLVVHLPTPANAKQKYLQATDPFLFKPHLKLEDVQRGVGHTLMDSMHLIPK